MEKINQLIEIVYDRSKRKLRARNIQDGRWCSFPNRLRVENKLFKAGKITKGRGDSWRASKPSEFPLNERNQELEDLLGLKNKAIKKEFYSVLISDNNSEIPKVNTEMLNIIFIVKSIFPEINEQLLKPLIKKYNHSAFLKEDLLVDIQNLLMNYNEKRVITLFSNYSLHDYLEDTVRMYKQLFENDIEIDNILPKKPKNIRELHDIFMRECSKIKKPKQSLNQEEIDFLNNKQVSEEYSIFIPKTTYDLIDIGNTLNICVGNGYYAKKILNKDVNIIALKDQNNNIKYCIEYNKSRIIQAKAYYNANMDDILKEKLSNIIYNKNLERDIA